MQTQQQHINQQFSGLVLPCCCDCCWCFSCYTAASIAVVGQLLIALPCTSCVACSCLQEALKGLHWLPTLDCLALSPDPAIKARAAAALAALATAGQLESQEAQIRWRDMLLAWLGSSTASLLLATSSNSSSSNGSDDSRSSATVWLWSWFGEESGADGTAGGKKGLTQVSAADEALARSCVAALRGEKRQNPAAPVKISYTMDGMWCACHEALVCFECNG